MQASFSLIPQIKRLLPNSLILLYHRVSDVIADPELLAVSPYNFAQHMEVLRRVYSPLSLSNLRNRLHFNLSKSRSVVVTFDDGYSDNLYEARPILDAADVEATVFVTAGNVTNQRPFWWDELARILLFRRDIPSELSLEIRGVYHQWRIHSDNGADSPERNYKWNVLMQDELTPRQETYLSLTRLLRACDANEREQAMDSVFEWAGNADVREDQDRALNKAELRQLAADGLVGIGAHSQSHPVLSALSPSKQWEEIIRSKESLEEILGNSIKDFSYPFGDRRDYGSDTVALVKQAGFDLACSNFPGVIGIRSDPYQLPRMVVRNWDGDEFEQRLSTWFDV